MKRDMDLIRKILEYLESQTDDLVKPPEFPNVTNHEVCYHARLCRQADYISEYKEVLSGDGPPKIDVCLLGALTWKGHEALAEMRVKRPCG